MKVSSQPPPPEPVGAPEGNSAYVDMHLLLGWYCFIQKSNEIAYLCSTYSTYCCKHVKL